MDVFRTFVVPAANQADAQAIFEHASDISAPGGIGMFTVGLSPTGSAPATFYINSGLVPTTWAALFPYARWTYNPVTQLWAHIQASNGIPVSVYNAAIAAGYSITQAQVNTILTTCDISDQDPWAVMARLGVQLVSAVI